jgi:hypothetical protein
LNGRFGVWDTDVVLFQKITDVQRFDRPNGLANGENVWSAKLVVLDPAAQFESVVELWSDVEHGGKPQRLNIMSNCLSNSAALASRT